MSDEGPHAMDAFEGPHPESEEAMFPSYDPRDILTAADALIPGEMPPRTFRGGQLDSGLRAEFLKQLDLDLHIAEHGGEAFMFGPNAWCAVCYLWGAPTPSIVHKGRAVGISMPDFFRLEGEPGTGTPPPPVPVGRVRNVRREGDLFVGEVTPENCMTQDFLRQVDASVASFAVGEFGTAFRLTSKEGWTCMLPAARVQAFMDHNEWDAFEVFVDGAMMPEDIWMPVESIETNAETVHFTFMPPRHPTAWVVDPSREVKIRELEKVGSPAITGYAADGTPLALHNVETGEPLVSSETAPGKTITLKGVGHGHGISYEPPAVVGSLREFEEQYGPALTAAALHIAVPPPTRRDRFRFALESLTTRLRFWR